MAGLPKERPDALDSPRTVRIIKAMAKAQVLVFKKTNGRIGSKWRVGAGFKKPVDTLLLEHVGRTSGRLFTTPLLYLRDDTGAASHTTAADLVVVGSQGGLPKHPQWYRNLLAEPDVHVWVRGEGRRPVRAVEVTDQADYDQLWTRLVDLYADFDTYKQWTERHIPVLRLTAR